MDEIAPSLTSLQTNPLQHTPMQAQCACTQSLFVESDYWFSHCILHVYSDRLVSDSDYLSATYNNNTISKVHCWCHVWLL